VYVPFNLLTKFFKRLFDWMNVCTISPKPKALSGSGRARRLRRAVWGNTPRPVPPALLHDHNWTIPFGLDCLYPLNFLQKSSIPKAASILQAHAVQENRRSFGVCTFLLIDVKEKKIVS